MLFAVCIAVFIAAERTGRTTEVATLLRFGATWRKLVWDGEYWRLFTSMFLHIGVMHLVWNVFFGFRWAAPIEKELGSWKYLAMYLASGVTGAALSVIGHDAVSAGASGSLFGVIGADLIISHARLGSWQAMINDPKERPKLTSTGLWFLIGAWAGFDNFAHFGGLLAGVALTWGFRSRSETKIAMAAALVLGITLAALRPIPGLHRLAIAQMQAQQALEAHDLEQMLEATRDAEQNRDPLLVWYRAEALEQLNRFDEITPLLPLIDNSQGERSRFLAATQFAKHDFETARRTIQSELNLGANTPMLRLALVRVLIEQEEFQQAITSAQQLLHDGAGDQTAFALQLIGNAYWRQQNTDAALEAFERADEAEGATSSWHVQLLIALSRADDARALLPTLKTSDAERRSILCGIELVSPTPANEHPCDGVTNESLWFVSPELLEARK